MNLVALAQTMTGAAHLVAIGLMLYAGFFLLVFLPRGQRTARYGVFIAADPRTVWDTYFFHAGRCDYRPGLRFLKCDILAENPLTVRYVAQADYARTPSISIFTYDVYEPYSRYRFSNGRISEEGELRQESGGTRLRTVITAPTRGWLFPWALRRRHDRNYRALKDVCEGRRPEAPHSILPPRRRWEGWVTAGGYVGLVALPAFQLMGVTKWPAILLLVAAGGLMLIRSIRSVLRLLALG